MNYSLINTYPKCHIMKLKNTFILSIVFLFIILSGQKTNAQTQGLIYKKTNPLNTILDPNGDGYVSTDTTGFQTNDSTESEIAYISIPVLETEPNSDQKIGPDGSYIDIIDNGTKNSVYVYYDGTNLLFRFRLGGTAANTKGYSILVDSDQKFGFTGSEADPNAVVGNPGFEFEIVLETQVGVALYNVDGTSSPSEIGNASTDRPDSTYSQKSIALTTTNGDPDYFYDFYVPMNSLTSAFGIDENTLLRFVGATVADAAAFIGSNEASDIAGTNEFYFSDIFECIPPIKISEIATANTDCRTSCPSINSLAHGATAVTGTSTEQDSTVIEVFKNGISIGTAKVSAGIWSLTGISPALASGDEIKATAKDSSRYVSFDDCNIQIVECSSVLNNLEIHNNRICGSGYISGFLFKIYHNGVEIPLAGDSLFTELNGGNWVYSCNGTSTCNNSGASCMQNGWYDVTQEIPGSCESKCVGIGRGAQTSILPVITTDPIKTNTTSVNGTGINGSIIILYQDSTILDTAIVNSSGVWSVSVSGLTACSEITARQVESGKKGSDLTAPVTVLSTNTYHKPIITGNYCITSGIISTVTGTSVEGENSEAEVFVNSTSVGTSLVLANETWELTGLTINIGDSITARIISGAGCLSESELSDTVIVTKASVSTATINSPNYEGNGSVSGICQSETSSKIYLYQDGILVGSTNVFGATWDVINIDANTLYAGGILTITRALTGECESNILATDTVLCHAPANLTITPAQSEYCENENAELVVGSSENDIVYTPILVSDGSVIGYSRIGNGSDLTLTTYALTNTTDITVKAEKICPISCESHTDSVTITINPLPDTALAVSSASANICRYDSVDITITGAEIGVTYQLQNAADDSNIGTYAHGGGTDLIISTGPLDTTVTIKVNATDYSHSTNCSVDLTNTVDITVTGAYNTQIVTADDNILCQSNSTNINVTTINDGYSYQVKQRPDISNIGLPFTGDGAVHSATTGNLTADETFYVEVDDGNGCIIKVLDEDTVVVNQCLRDIYSEKTVDDNTPDEGDTITYTITVTNNEVSDDVTSLVITDSLPAGLTFVSATPSAGTWTAPNWNIGTLAAISTENIQIQATVNTGTGGSVIQNIISNTQYETDNNLTDIDTLDITVNNNADIVLTKTVDDAAPDEGQTINFTITATNNGPAQAKNLVVTDVLPAGLTFVSATPASSWAADDWTIGTLNKGETDTLTITVTVDAGTGGDTIKNIVSKTQDQTDTTNTDVDEADIIVNNEADIVLTKTVNDAAPDEGQNITYTLTVKNNGPAQVKNLKVTDVLPAGLTFVSATPAGSWAADDWTIGTLNKGASETLTITATVDAGTGGDTITNTIYNTQDQTDLNITTDDLNEVIIVNNDADIVLTKTVDDNTPDEGQIITYTVTVSNNGPAQAKNLIINDELPAGLTFISATTTKGTWTAPNWSIDTLNNSENAFLIIVASVDAGTGGTTITNTISNIQEQTDLNSTFDDNDEAITVNNIADIVLTKTADNITPNEGDTVTFTVTVTNNGPAQAKNLAVTDTLPAGLTFVNAVPTTGNWASPNWTIGTLNRGATENIDIKATVDAGTGGSTITNTISNTQDQTDSNTSTDDDIEVITINNDADIVLTKVVDNASPDEGQTITYTITVTNNGPAQATNLVITDVLPTDLTFVSATPSTGTWSAGDWTIGTLDNGATATMIITETVNIGTGGMTLTNSILNNQDQADNNNTTDIQSVDMIVNNDADIVLTKIVDNNTPNAGDNITFTITVTNNGPAQAQNLLVTDVLPSGLTFVSAVPSAGTWSADDWTIGTLNNGATETLTLTATVDTGTNGFDITNTVSNSQEQTDTNISTDDDNEIIYVNDVPVANDDTETTDEDNALINDVLINDTGLSDGGIVVNEISGVTNGVLDLNSDGTYTYTPDQDYHGFDSFVYEVCDTENDCDQATVNITINSVNDLPEAQDDEINVDEDSQLNEIFVIEDNGNGPDYFGGDGPGTTPVAIITATENGTIDFDDNGTPDDPTDDFFIYTPNRNFFGNDSFEYEICDSDGDCDQAIVNIEVINDNVLFFPQIITPNNDGFNDYFYVEGLEAFPENTLIIFNRWGNKVFEASPYNNDWNGKANFGITLNGNDLPEGTYYYILKTGNEDKDIKGYIYLKR